MAGSLDAEFKSNFSSFTASLLASNSTIQGMLVAEEAIFLRSYKLICAFRGWHEIALGSLSEDAVGFFIESHNDILTSHVHATGGMWRSALISLRSFMESYLAFIYFKDHLIELEQWKLGAFRIEPKTLRQYCVSHPALKNHKILRSATAQLDAEYSKLSGSVHASKVDFRMTSPSTYPSIATDDLIKLRKWQSLEKQVVNTALVIFLGLSGEKLRGAANPLFRKILGASLASPTKQAIKDQLGIIL